MLFPFQHFGLAIALTLASAFNALCLLWLLRRRVGPFMQNALLSPLVRSVPGCLVMSACVYFMLGVVDWRQEGRMLLKCAVLSASVAIGFVSYVGIGHLFRVEQIQQGWELLKKSKKRSAG